jgi:hypothetical protein
MMDDYSSLQEILPFILPLLLIQLALLALGVWDWAHRQRFRYLDRWVWLAIIVLVATLGPLIYLLVGREES